MTRISLYLTLLLLALFTSLTVLGDTLYKWVDDQGNVHYSDKPQPGATKVHLPKPTTYAAPDVAAPAAQAAGSEGKNKRAPVARGYNDFEIAAPAADQTYWNVQSVTVTITVQPALHAGDTVTITLDDKSQGPGGSTSATFDGLDRGEHTVHATLTMTGGGTMIAKPVTFYIQRGTKGALSKVITH